MYSPAQDEVRDSWMDNIDWVKVKQNTEGEEKEQATDSESEEESDKPNEMEIRKGQ